MKIATMIRLLVLLAIIGIVVMIVKTTVGLADEAARGEIPVLLASTLIILMGVVGSAVCCVLAKTYK